MFTGSKMLRTDYAETQTGFADACSEQIQAVTRSATDSP